ncbi:uncharacterized protein LOC127861703 [Dreissena polymorpha]|uniref:uncharacterized protein LOC127861703 n=1 Tax=Dreissena polymorpha TaxID=45954 RepID=UPI002264C64A|nr:uncharacterized protein LOC127861703 [Dreissena polymorpha]
MGDLDEVNSNHGAGSGHNVTVINVAHQYFMTETNGDFIFQGVHIWSVAGIAIAMVIVMILSALWQTLQYWYNQLQNRVLASRNDRHSAVMHNRTHCKMTCLRMTTVLLGHVTMLCVMSMNIWLLVAVVMGSGLAYLFLYSNTIRDIAREETHVLTDPSDVIHN